MTTIIISVILVLLAGILNSLMDKIRVWHNSRWSNLSSDNWFYKWAGPGGSWKNKWKLDSDGNIIPLTHTLWYYLWVYKPDNKERFPYSSTFLVFATDGWHFFQMFWWTFVVLAISINLPELHWLVWFIILSVVRMASFTFFYDYILRKKKDTY